MGGGPPACCYDMCREGAFAWQELAADMGAVCQTKIMTGEWLCGGPLSSLLLCLPRDCLIVFATGLLTCWAEVGVVNVTAIGVAGVPIFEALVWGQRVCRTL